MMKTNWLVEQYIQVCIINLHYFLTVNWNIVYICYGFSPVHTDIFIKLITIYVIAVFLTQDQYTIS